MTSSNIDGYYIYNNETAYDKEMLERIAMRKVDYSENELLCYNTSAVGQRLNKEHEEMKQNRKKDHRHPWKECDVCMDWGLTSPDYYETED